MTDVFQSFRLDGRTALVTGGSRGIGKAVARGLVEAGARVLISAREEETLQAAAEEIGNGLDTTVEYLVADMADRDQVDSLGADARSHLGHVDILFNNAGTNEPQTLIETQDDSCDRVLEINFTSCMRLARMLVPDMIERQWGRIIHTSSVMAMASNAGRGIYSATKSALIAMSRAHALELGPHGITVNCLAPGPILTDLPMSILNQEQQDVFARRTALLRWGTVDEMVGPVLLLASDAGAYMTGSVILADGGLICRTFD